MFWNMFKREQRPYLENFLETDDGYKIYYRAFGNPQGIPVLSFHGGPGGSSRPKYAKLFAKNKFNFIQFDQRGCGNSTAIDIWRNNNTQYLLNDAYNILQKLNIKGQIIVHGVSWGATLALLFAEKFPQMVQKIVVSSVFLARQYDNMWVQQDSGRFYPDLWAQMRAKVHCRDIHSVYRRLLFSNRASDNIKAMTYWGSYEYMLGKLNPQFSEPLSIDEAELTAMRLAAYYAEHNYFMRENQILRQINKIKHIPTLIVHNRMDFCCPLQQAWDLHQALPQSKLIIVPACGHSTPQLLKIVKKEISSW